MKDVPAVQMKRNEQPDERKTDRSQASRKTLNYNQRPSHWRIVTTNAGWGYGHQAR